MHLTNDENEVVSRRGAEWLFICKAKLNLKQNKLKGTVLLKKKKMAYYYVINDRWEYLEADKDQQEFRTYKKHAKSEKEDLSYMCLLRLQDRYCKTLSSTRGKVGGGYSIFCPLMIWGIVKWPLKHLSS